MKHIRTNSLGMCDNITYGGRSSGSNRFISDHISGNCSLYPPWSIKISTSPLGSKFKPINTTIAFCISSNLCSPKITYNSFHLFSSSIKQYSLCDNVKVLNCLALSHDGASIVVNFSFEGNCQRLFHFWRPERK